MNKLAQKLIFLIPLTVTLTALSLLFSCSKEEYEYPVVYTGEEFDMTEERIILNAHFTRMGNEEIIDYGFQINRWDHWTRIKNSSPFISLKSIPIEDLSFSLTLYSGMVPNRSYDLRAYASTTKGTSYGNTIRVHNIVDNPVQLNYFEPSMAHQGDTLSLFGSFFNPYISYDSFRHKGDENIVRFNNKKAKVVFASDGLLKVIVPVNLTETLSTISVEVRHTTSSFNDQFSLPQFRITDFEPKEGVMNQEVTLYCNTDLSGLTPVVRVGNKKAIITSQNNNQIKILIPGTLTHGHYSISLTVNNHNTSAPSPFRFIEIWKQLPDHPHNDKVRMISFNLDGRLFSGGGQRASGTELGFMEYHPGNNTWTPMAAMPGNSPNIVHFPERGYIIHDKLFYRFSPIHNIWYYRGVFPGEGVTDQVAFSFANRLFVGTGKDSSGNPLDEFWMYNESDNTWVEIESWPHGPSYGGTGVSFNNRGYVVFGVNGSGGNYITRLNLGPFTWEVLKEIDIDGSDTRLHAIALPLENEILMGLGITHTGSSNQSDLYLFNPQNNTLKRTLDLPIDRAGKPAIAISRGKIAWIGESFYTANWPSQPPGDPQWGQTLLQFNASYLP